MGVRQQCGTAASQQMAVNLANDAAPSEAQKKPFGHLGVNWSANSSPHVSPDVYICSILASECLISSARSCPRIGLWWMTPSCGNKEVAAELSSSIECRWISFGDHYLGFGC